MNIEVIRRAVLSSALVLLALTASAQTDTTRKDAQSAAAAAARQHFAERKRNRRAADKKEERHHQIPEAEARPRLVVELEKDSAGGGRVYLPQHGTRHRLQEYQQKEVKAPQNV